MFSKYATLLAFVASAIAGVIEPGVYKISNVASHSTARSYQAFRPVYVSSTREFAGPFELWNIKDSEDGSSYTLENVGLGAYASASDSPGAVVETKGKGAPFVIEAAGNGQYEIKLQNSDLLWNVEPPIIPRGEVKLRRPNGHASERWTFTLAKSD